MKAVFVLFLVACVAPLAPSVEKSSSDVASPFKVEIAIKADSLRNDLYHQHGLFQVDAKSHTGEADQTVVVWTQSGWSWLSDNPAIFPEIAAQQNVTFRVNLKPAEVHREPVEMGFGLRKSTPVTFRLGFCPKAESPISGQPNLAGTHHDEITWSNVGTINRRTAMQLRHRTS